MSKASVNAMMLAVSVSALQLAVNAGGDDVRISMREASFERASTRYKGIVGAGSGGKNKNKKRKAQKLARRKNR